MSALRVFLVDDEAPARARLATLLEDIAAQLPNVVVGEAEHGGQALDRLAASPADVVLLDIRMPAMDGIELAQHLARMEAPPAIVFVTAYDQYAVQAFELNAVDYLLKPVRAQRLQAALEKSRGRVPDRATLQRLQQGARRHLSCTERGRILLVPVEQIDYLRADHKYVVAHTAAREYLLEESLVQLEQEFAARFVRIHRGCLVAREAVAGFERNQGEEAEGGWSLLLKGGEVRLPVSRRLWPTVKASLAELGRAGRP